MIFWILQVRTTICTDISEFTISTNINLIFINFPILLIDAGFVDRGRIIGYGKSAGAIPVAGALNNDPLIFKGVILEYPFLNVLSLMDNPSIPLTTLEYSEWGNPKFPAIRKYISSYSPYQNLHLGKYPSIYINSSSNDYQTPLWQILQYTAKIRSIDQSKNNIILLKVSDTGGHGGRKNSLTSNLRDLSYQYAFIHEILGLD